MRRVALILGSLALGLSACGGDRDQAAAVTYSDPFAYCAATGNADTPGAAYIGAKVPDSVAGGLKAAVGAPTDAPLDDFRRGAFWRCMNGKVYACTVGANLPCQSKADVNRAPSLPVRKYCRNNPNAEFIPAYVTGRDTIFEWRCRGGETEIVKQIATPDPRGWFYSNKGT